jgi:hypothetical protein
MNTTLNARKLLSLTLEQREALATTKTHAIELAIFEAFIKETPITQDSMTFVQDLMDAASNASNKRYVIEESRRVLNGIYNIALTEGWSAAQDAAKKSLVSVQDVLTSRNQTKHILQQ